VNQRTPDSCALPLSGPGRQNPECLVALRQAGRHAGKEGPPRAGNALSVGAQETLPGRSCRAQALRLRLDLGRSHREIGLACKKSPSTVGDCLMRFRASKLPWPLPEELDDNQLEKKLYPPAPPSGDKERPEPDWDTSSVSSRIRTSLWSCSGVTISGTTEAR
jgi:hypothetical protein